MKYSFFIAMSCFALSCSESKFSSGAQPARNDGDVLVDPSPGSSSNPNPTADGEQQSEKIQLTPGSKTLSKSDVIFLVDTSGSMRGERAALEAHMASFLQDFQTSAQGDAIHVFAVGTGFSFPVQSGAIPFKIIPDGIGSHSALDVLLRLIKASTFRADARLDAVVISDDNASLSAVNFKSQIQSLNLKQGLRLHSIVGLSKGGGIAAVGHTYMQLSDDPAHRGEKLDIRAKDWKTLLGQLSSSIISTNSQSVYRLQFPPDLAKPLSVSINGVAKTPQEIKISEDGSVTILSAELQSVAGALDISYFKK